MFNNTEGMQIKAVNLNSKFDWGSNVSDVFNSLNPSIISSELSVPELAEAIALRLGELRYVFLVNSLSAYTDQCAYGENQNKRPRTEFPVRRRHSILEGYYRRPTRSKCGGVIDYLGVYTKNVRDFDPELELPDDVGNEPAILICPELLFELPYRLVQQRLLDGDPHPDPDVVHLFFKMTLLHELGHHMLPAPLMYDDYSQYISEGLANYFCNSLLDAYGQKWLFVKASSQPSPYLAYAAPYSLRKLNDLSLPCDFWQQTVYACFGKNGSQIVSLLDKHDPGRKLIASPAMLLAAEGLSESLNDRTAMRFIDCQEACAVTPFEEMELLGAGAPELLSLLDHVEPSVQVTVVSALLELSCNASLDSSIIARIGEWCDQRIHDADIWLARKAWDSPLANRLDGIVERYLDAAQSIHETVASEVPQRAAMYLSHSEAEKVLAVSLVDKRMPVCLEAYKAVAELRCREKDVAGIEKLLLVDDGTLFSAVWAVIITNRPALSPESLLQIVRNKKREISCEAQNWYLKLCIGGDDVSERIISLLSSQCQPLRTVDIEAISKASTFSLDLIVCFMNKEIHTEDKTAFSALASKMTKSAIENACKMQDPLCMDKILLKLKGSAFEEAYQAMYQAGFKISEDQLKQVISRCNRYSDLKKDEIFKFIEYSMKHSVKYQDSETLVALMQYYIFIPDMLDSYVDEEFAAKLATEILISEPKNIFNALLLMPSTVRETIMRRVKDLRIILLLGSSSLSRDRLIPSKDIEKKEQEIIKYAVNYWLKCHDTHKIIQLLESQKLFPDLWALPVDAAFADTLAGIIVHDHKLVCLALEKMPSAVHEAILRHIDMNTIDDDFKKNIVCSARHDDQAFVSSLATQLAERYHSSSDYASLENLLNNVRLGPFKTIWNWLLEGNFTTRTVLQKTADREFKCLQRGGDEIPEKRYLALKAQSLLNQMDKEETGEP